MNDCLFIGPEANIHPNDNSLIVSNGNMPDTDKAVSANEIVDNVIANDKSGNNERCTYHNYNDTYRNAGNVDDGKTMIAYRSEDKADLAIDCNIKKNISIHDEKKETEMKKR